MEGISDPLEITNQYILEKDILPKDDPDKEVQASKQLKRFVNRYRGEVQDELEGSNKSSRNMITS